MWANEPLCERCDTLRCKVTNFADGLSVTIWKALESAIRPLSSLPRSKSKAICEKDKF